MGEGGTERERSPATPSLATPLPPTDVAWVDFKLIKNHDTTTPALLLLLFLQHGLVSSQLGSLRVWVSGTLGVRLGLRRQRHFDKRVSAQIELIRPGPGMEGVRWSTLFWPCLCERDSSCCCILFARFTQRLLPPTTRNIVDPNQVS